VVENFFPPSPSDTFVAMAAFLSHQGHYDPVAIFLTSWISGIGGSAGVFYLARRHADRLTDSRLGRLLLPPEATAFLLKEYGRYGAFGMLITRLLPGFRSVVAPFAGLSRLSLRQLLVPVAAATALWYATLTWVGAKLGDQWDVVVGILDAIYGALGIAAVVVAVLLVGGILWWRRRRTAP
jgi:membrane protein DedA with SNARE-associated domain